MPFHRAIPESKPPEKSSGGLSAYIEAEKLLHLAFVLPAAVFIGWAAGWWAGRHLHQTWMEFAGIVLGSFAGLLYVIQTAMAAEKKSRLQDEAQNGSGKGSSENHE
jgi:uncharacterized membrane protein YfcA